MLRINLHKDSCKKEIMRANLLFNKWEKDGPKPIARTGVFPTITGLTLFSHNACILQTSCVPKRIPGIHDIINNNIRFKKPMILLPLPHEKKAVLII